MTSLERIALVVGAALVIVGCSLWDIRAGLVVAGLALIASTLDWRRA